MKHETFAESLNIIECVEANERMKPWKNKINFELFFKYFLTSLYQKQYERNEMKLKTKKNHNFFLILTILLN